MPAQVNGGGRAARPTVAVVLPGGGARGAYEIGALSVLLPALEARGERVSVYCGTSVGAINATTLASLAHLSVEEQVATTLAHWRELRKRDVLTAAFFLSRECSIFFGPLFAAAEWFFGAAGDLGLGGFVGGFDGLHCAPCCFCAGSGFAAGGFFRDLLGIRAGETDEPERKTRVPGGIAFADRVAKDISVGVG